MEVQALESFAFLDVLEEVISSMARMVATSEKIGVKVGWLDKAIGDM